MQPSVDNLNPLNHIGEAQYAAIWRKLFVTVLAGFWAKFFFVILLMLAVFFGVRRRNPRASALFAILAAALAYGGGIVDAFKLLRP